MRLCPREELQTLHNLLTTPNSQETTFQTLSLKHLHNCALLVGQYRKQPHGIRWHNLANVQHHSVSTNRGHNRSNLGRESVTSSCSRCETTTKPYVFEDSCGRLTDCASTTSLKPNAHSRSLTFVAIGIQYTTRPLISHTPLGQGPAKRYLAVCLYSHLYVS